MNDITHTWKTLLGTVSFHITFPIVKLKHTDEPQYAFLTLKQIQVSILVRQIRIGPIYGWMWNFCILKMKRGSTKSTGKRYSNINRLPRQ